MASWPILEKARVVPQITMMALPVEIIVYVISLLSARDKIRICCASRSLRTICEIPLLWKEFSWSWYTPRDDISLMCVFKKFGKHIEKLHFADNIAPSKLEVMLMFCKNLIQLSVPKVNYDSNEVIMEKIVGNIPSLQIMSIRISMSIPQLIQQVLILFSNFKELSLHVKYPIFKAISLFQPISTGSFIQEWENCNYLPRKLNIIQENFSAHNFYSTPTAYFWSQLPMLPSKTLPNITDPGHTAWLSICYTESSFLPVVPVIQLRVTDSSVALPLIEIKLLDLNYGILHLTQDSYHGAIRAKVHKAILIDKCDEYFDTTANDIIPIV